MILMKEIDCAIFSQTKQLKKSVQIKSTFQICKFFLFVQLSSSSNVVTEIKIICFSKTNRYLSQEIFSPYVMCLRRFQSCFIWVHKKVSLFLAEEDLLPSENARTTKSGGQSICSELVGMLQVNYGPGS